MNYGSMKWASDHMLVMHSIVLCYFPWKKISDS